MRPTPKPTATSENATRRPSIGGNKVVLPHAPISETAHMDMRRRSTYPAEMAEVAADAPPVAALPTLLIVPLVSIPMNQE